MPRVSDYLLFEKREQPVLEITFEASLDQLADRIVVCMERLHSYLGELDGALCDVPYIACANREDIHTRPVKISVGFPTVRQLPGRGEIVSGIIPAGKNLSCICRGSYLEMHSIYDSMVKWILDHGFEASGGCYEYYYNGAEMPEEEYITKLVILLE